MDTVSQQQTSTSNDMIVGFVGIAISVFFILLGWLPVWIVISVLIVGASMFNTGYFATGVIGTLTAGIFTFLTWFPSWAFFSFIIIAALLLANKIVTEQTKNVTK